MAIIKQQYPYEYLVRYNPDGTVRGQHIKYLDRVFDDVTNEIYAEKEGEALSVGDAQSAVMLDVALGEVNAALAKAEQAERTAKEAALAARQAAETERAAKQAEVDALNLRLTEAQALADSVLAAKAAGQPIGDELEATIRAKRQAP